MKRLSKRKIHEIVLSKFDSKCAYCGVDVTYSTMICDHIFPKCEGGDDSIDNLNPSCASCNSSKGRRLIEMFRIQLRIKKSKFAGIINPNQWLKLIANGATVEIGEHEFYFERHKKAPR